VVDKNNLLKPIESLYSDSLSEHGASPQGVGWKSIHEQQMRFEKLTELIDTEEDFTVADYGCGYAAMFNFLDERFGSRLLEYHGYDICEGMIEATKAKVTDSRAQFYCSDTVIKPVDYIFISGTYNVKLKSGEDDWREFIHSNLLELWAHSNRGLAFNLFTTKVDYYESQLFYGDPGEFFNFCLKHLSPNLKLVHDYPLYEWTMLIHHRQSSRKVS